MPTELSVVFGERMFLNVTMLTSGEKLFFRGSDMPEGMCEPVCVHGSAHVYTMCMSGGSAKRRRTKYKHILIHERIKLFDQREIYINKTFF